MRFLTLALAFAAMYLLGVYVAQYTGPKFTPSECTTFETGFQETKPRYVEDQNGGKLYTFVDVIRKQTVTICQRSEWK
jgi:hypothetical protein